MGAMKAEDSDQNYLISRSKRAKNPREARAWMMTAKLMFPDDLNIQFEAYSVEKRQEKVQESSKYLQSMYINFNEDPRVWKELNEIIDSMLQNDHHGSNRGKFSPIMVFENLPADIREKIIYQASSNALKGEGSEGEKLVEYVKLTMLLLAEFPRSAASRGPEMLETLLKGIRENPEDKELLDLAVNRVCPSLLSNSSLELSETVLEDLIHMILHDYLYKRCVILSTVLAWEPVLNILQDLGSRLGWSLTNDVKADPLETSWERAMNFSQKETEDPSSGLELYAFSITLFLKTFSDYIEDMKAPDSNDDKNEPDYIMVEAFVTHSVEDGPAGGKIKRRRTTDEERRVPLLTFDNEEEDRPKRNITDNFLYALRFYQLLHSESALESRFSRLLESKGASKTLTHFSIDALIYESKYREALQVLRQLPTPVTSEEQGKFHLKMATVRYCLKDSNAAADQVIQAIGCLPPSSRHEGSSAIKSEKPKGDSVRIKKEEDYLQKPTVKSRHLHFLRYSRRQIISYITRILIHLLKEKAFQPSGPEGDLALGHIIVLLQYAWPCEADLFYMIIHRIRMKESFAYPLFCNYVIEIEFLEEFMWMASEQGGAIPLDIIPNSSSSSGRRVGTRGANRGEKEEFRSAIRKQVKRSHENLDEVIIDFLTQNRESIFRCLI